MLTSTWEPPQPHGGEGGNSSTTEVIRELRDRMIEAGDWDHADKVAQLLEKARSGRLNMAFCGHFSAGKSSLINRLCGHQLLPSSPIPTSANIVSIASGEPGATVWYHRKAEDGQARSEHVPLEQLAEHCRNGEAVETIDITYPIPMLQDRAALLDTPGIDSTDDAHQLSTESALHLADVVFYVMDYNHVLSEVNLGFTKKMVEWGKPLYLIVNMIDKHREQEVALEAYKAGVKEAFASWGVRPDGILYTSVKMPDHPASEWDKLDWLFAGLIERREELVRQSLEKSARALALAHAAKLEEDGEPAKEALRTRLAEDEASGSAQAEYAEASGELRRLEALPAQLMTQLRGELNALLDNANVTPASTRDLANAYLDSRRPGFKVGWLGAAAKTAAEREQRLQALTKDIASQAQTQIARHVQQTVKLRLEGHGLPPERLNEAAGAIVFEITPEWLASQVNEAAVFGGEYTLTYSRQIAAELKSAYRKRAVAAVEELTAELDAALRMKCEELAAQLAELETRLVAFRELERLEQADAAYREALLAPLPVSAAPELPSPEAAPRAAAVAAGQPQPAAAAPALAWLAADAAAAGDGAQTLAAGGHRDRLRETAARLQAAAEELSSLSALRSVRRSLLEKAERLSGNRFTIALFGAFSAGKSSFANALIGERVLPVSPNPTTAAINKIMPPEPEAGWPHGTAKVRMKSRERLVDDVIYSLEALGAKAETMEQALQAIAGLEADRIPGKGKPHYAFLRAVLQGWDAMNGLLGQDLKITAEEFGAYAAEEAKSCFVELIELYYTNPLTEQGIVLVDTPGADSINARHTGVAFDYIKNADAILFVTYYNHAFSHADKQFLLQLGRVKESFELDKMFFIVNAADLASSAEELEGVVGHVESNLLQHGIRHPRIYPLSSYYALEGKQMRDEALTVQSGISAFERDFIRFTFDELTDMAVQAGQSDIRRAAETLQRWIEGARSDAAVRGEQSAALRIALQAGVNRLERASGEADTTELSKEIQELLYYVKQRATYRFGELFNVAFNPSLFNDDPRDTKTVLQSAWEDLRRMISFDLSQEILATTLRVENKINRMAKQAVDVWTSRLREDIPSFEPSGFEAFKLSTPDLHEILEADEIQAKWLASYFKNTKQFYEGEGKSQLRRDLEAKLVEPMTRFTEAQAAQLEAAYADQLRRVVAALAGQWTADLEEHVAGQLEALDMKLDMQAMQEKHSRLLRFLVSS
ncbi:dynamin family protein [Paenibacillus puerhi]|uniref:dynamin family protein n=1 Tax=Paenibacillus puerhi TaxID=2692622 RepID=UPI001F1E2534|nr:dynamin family protein [Paenibacillus puerhi]